MNALVVPLSLAAAALTGAVGWLLASRRRIARQLDATRRLFSESMNLAPFCAYMKDADGRYIYENPCFIAITRQALPHIRTFLGKTDRDFFPAEQARQYMADDGEVLRQGKPIAFDNSSVDADGTVRQWFSVKFPWIDEHGRSCVAGVSIDTSEVERAQATAKASDDHCKLALEAGSMGSMSLDLSTLMLDTSPVFAVLHGRPETTTRLSLDESLLQVHPDDRAGVTAAVQAALAKQPPKRIRYRVVKPDGGIAWIELAGEVFYDGAGRPTLVRGVAFDITEERTAYEELSRRKAVLRRLIEVQENERQTLCHELHDGLIQYAIGAKMQLDSARDEVDPAVRVERIDAALECLDRGIAEGRQVIRGVRPAVLDDLGLTAAIVDLAEQMADAGITVETSLDGGLDSVPPQLCTTIYRIVQESLTNIRKHAGVDRATVEVRRAADDVDVRVRDHGTGFDVDDARTRGFGLVGMTERVRLAGGTFWIESQPNAGTEINARLPVAGAATDAAVRPMGKAAYAAAPVLPLR